MVLTFLLFCFFLKILPFCRISWQFLDSRRQFCSISELRWSCGTLRSINSTGMNLLWAENTFRSRQGTPEGPSDFLFLFLLYIYKILGYQDQFQIPSVQQGGHVQCMLTWCFDAKITFLLFLTKNWPVSNRLSHKDFGLGVPKTTNFSQKRTSFKSIIP